MNPNATPTGFFGTKVSQPGINVARANANQLLFTNDYNTETFYDLSGNARVVIGKLPDGSEGMWVSAPGVNANTAQPNTPGQIIFNSNQTGLGIVRTIRTEIPSFAITFDGTETTGNILFTVPHGQSFTPIVQVYVQGGLATFPGPTVTASSYIPVPITNTMFYWFLSASATYYPLTVTFAVDATNVYIQAFYFANGGASDVINAIPTTIFVEQNTAAS